MIIPFQSPFVYDPSQGNLYMEVFFTYQGDFSTDWVTTAGTSGEFIGGDIGDTTAFFHGWGDLVTSIHRRTPNPQPSLSSVCLEWLVPSWPGGNENERKQTIV